MTIGRRIHTFRKMLKLTLKELADKSQLSVGYLSKLERSDRVPPLATIQTIATTLKVSVSELLEEYKPTSRILHEDNDITIIKNNPEMMPEVSEEGYALVQLTRNYMNRYMSPFMLNIPPGETAEFRHDAEEFNYVVRGPLKLRYKGNLYCFEEGDSFYFDSRHPHVFINDGERLAQVLSVVYIYRKF